jgi:glucosyl-dolichyl phosphate glucuronosyltransferase
VTVRPAISVVVCTFNRVASLRETLQSLVDQSLPAGSYEVLIVDNRSTDDTADLVRGMKAAHSAHRLHLLREEQQGLSHARNTGVSAATGDLVAFTDDDVRVPPHWLEDSIRAFESTPVPHGVGGPVLPLYPDGRPSWFKDEYETDSWGDEARLLRSGESFSGNNMLFRADVLRRAGAFDPRLGMTGERIGLGEDTDLFHRIWQAEPGARLLYVPELYVRHSVPRHRLRLRYICRRFFASGQASFMHRHERTLPGRAYASAAGAAVSARGLARVVCSAGRGRTWRQRVVEDAAEVFTGLGLAAAALGVRPVFTERPVPQPAAPNPCGSSSFRQRPHAGA